jgi:hypothetical protein
LIWGATGLFAIASISLTVYAVVLERAYRHYVGPRPPPLKNALSDEQLVLLGVSVSEVRWAIDNKIATRTPQSMQQNISELQTERGSSFFRNPIDGNPILINPNVMAWSDDTKNPSLPYTALVVTWIGKGPLNEHWVCVYTMDERYYLGPDSPERVPIDMDWVSELPEYVRQKN